MQTAEQKAKIKQLMIAHLKSKGYPNMTSKEILAELKPMWVKLGAAGLLRKDWKYGDFVQIAEAEEHFATLKEALNDEVRDFIAGQKKP